MYDEIVFTKQDFLFKKKKERNMSFKLRFSKVTHLIELKKKIVKYSSLVQLFKLMYYLFI